MAHRRTCSSQRTMASSSSCLSFTSFAARTAPSMWVTRIAREHQLKCWSRKKKAALISGNPTGLKRSSKRTDATRHAQTFTWLDLLRHSDQRHGQR
jgi:hypothetical protein